MIYNNHRPIHSSSPGYFNQGSSDPASCQARSRSNEKLILPPHNPWKTGKLVLVAFNYGTGDGLSIDQPDPITRSCHHYSKNKVHLGFGGKRNYLVFPQRSTASASTTCQCVDHPLLLLPSPYRFAAYSPSIRSSIFHHRSSSFPPTIELFHNVDTLFGLS